MMKFAALFAAFSLAETLSVTQLRLGVVGPEKDPQSGELRADTEAVEANATSGRVSKVFEPLSLLHVSESRKSQEAMLPRVNQVLTEPNKVLEAMNQHVDTISASLNEAQSQHAVRIKKQAAEYERKLGKQAFKIQAAETANAKLESFIHDVQSSNVQLRKQALAITAENQRLRLSFQRMQANVSTALEFTATALGSAQHQLHNASELSVLLELDEEDERHDEEQAHANELKAVAGRQVAMLEISVGRSSSQSPETDMMETLLATLQQLEQEQNASAMELKGHFERQLQAGKLRYQSLLEKQAKLNTTKAQEVEINNQLLQAVEHLKQTRKKLVKENASIRAYMNELSNNGDRQQGVSHTADNTQASFAAPLNKTSPTRKAHKHAKKQENASMLADQKQLETAVKDFDKHDVNTSREKKGNNSAKGLDHDRAEKKGREKQMDAAVKDVAPKRGERFGDKKSAKSVAADTDQKDSWLNKLKSKFQWR